MKNGWRSLDLLNLSDSFPLLEFYGFCCSYFQNELEIFLKV